jgi:hypothetical protein
MNSRIDVPLDKVLSARGTLIVGGDTYNAYCIFLQGRWQEARGLLIQEHFNTYFGDRLNITTDKIVAEIYVRAGLKKPENYKHSDEKIVKIAVTQRVDGYLVQLEKFRQNGYVETDIVRMSRKGDQYIMRSCGENKVAALAALGHQTIPGVMIV